MLTVLLPVVLLAGALAGLLAGLLGVGGGVVIVPVLAYAYASAAFPADAVMQFALATSLASISFTGLSSVRAHHRRGAVRWDLVRMLTIPLVLGALAGTQVADALGSVWLMRLFGIFALLIGLQMLFARTAADDPAVPEPAIPPVRSVLAGGVIGMASALFGIGGGSLTVPWLHAAGVRMQRAVATSSACGVPIALAGTAGFVLAGLGRSDLPAGALGYVHLPSFIVLVVASVPMATVGARWAHRLPARALRRIFALLLLIVGADFLLRG
ncbi:MAG: sulfite exporter TauE/SafE family protein [Pseudomonadota bacterium]